MTSEVSPIQQANRDGAQRLQATEDGFTASTRFIARLRPHCPQMPLFHARQDSRAQAWTLPGGSQLQIGAVERTRTSTALRPTAPKAVASASSATTALAIFSHVLRLGSMV